MKLFRFLLIVLLAAISLPVLAQQQPVISGSRDVAGYEQLTISDSAAHGFAAIPGPSSGRNVTLSIIVVEGAAVRFRNDGTAPTASVGMPIGVNGEFDYTGDPTKLKFIQQTGTTAVINVLYFY